MDLSIIYVNWNSVDYLRECIESVYQYTHGIRFEMIVVDNASPERGIGTLREKFPEVTIIESDKNLGFAGANNLGFSRSVGAYVLFLNPDTKLIGPAIEIMVQEYQVVTGCRDCRM